MAEKGGSFAAWLLRARRRLQREEGGRLDVAGRRRRSAGKKTCRRKLAKAAGVQEIPTAASVAAVYLHEEEGEAVQVIGSDLEGSGGREGFKTRSLETSEEKCISPPLTFKFFTQKAPHPPN